MIELLVPILVGVSVLMIGAGVLTARSAGQKSAQKRLREMQMQFLSLEQSESKSIVTRFLGLFGRKVSGDAPSTNLREILAKAGYHSSSAPAIYMGFKHSLLLVGLVIGAAIFLAEGLALPVKALAMITSAVLLFFLPNIYLDLRRRSRTQQMRQHIPDMVDLLEICVVSGMGLDMAWNCVAEEIRRVSRVLADEMALTNLEMHLGAARSVAMRHMSERTGVTEMSSLVALLVQADRFGTTISATLEIFANSMREQRSLAAQECAEKMAVKLLFPMVLFIFPAVMIVMVGPAAIELFKAMSER